MPLTPVEIRHISLKRAWLRGYRRGGVDQLLQEIVDSFEEVWRERADLVKHRELEALLRSTLVSAERASLDMKEQARRESDLIVQEAHAESRRITREAVAEKRRLEDEMVRIRSQLRAALESLGEWPGETEEEPSSESDVSQTRPAIGEVTDGGIRKVVG
jgi:cell division initiation protein